MIMSIPDFKLRRLLKPKLSWLWCGIKVKNTYYLGFEDGLLAFDIKRLAVSSKRLKPRKSRI